ncbi:porin family protein [Vibrio sp. JC009]|uniref:outer membrane beta-barrel protein n=1 Tax=Vibrio sp. JC009 TaxID=2912314 RepID=UPI0023B0249F|nr:outer membrane beta-barrel protein [Vibrio sp. JC009]WED20548.1 porin family protein [Vibrio sp. JC009]
MKKALLALTLASFAGSAAADALIYGGAKVGQSNYEGKDSTSTEVYVGTGLLPFLGLEAGYVNHGSFEVTSNLDTDIDSVYFAVRPSIDIGPLHIYARGGVHRWNWETGALEDDGTNMLYGVGVEYFMAGPIAIGAGYSVYEMDDRDDIEQFTLTATFHFL